MLDEPHDLISELPEYGERIRALQQNDSEFRRLLADYDAYVTCQEHIDVEFLETDSWTRKAVLNVAAMGPFSADRAIHEYARKIWRIKPLNAQP